MSTDAFAYMCKVSFEDDLRAASDGTRIFPSEKTLRRHCPCIRQCGAVKVRVSLVAVIQEENYSELLDDIRSASATEGESAVPKGDADA